jgi:hypothetical protein
MEEETVEVEREIVPDSATPPQEDPQERNWREVNRILSEQKREIEELKQLKAAQEEPEEKYDPDDIVTFEKLDKMAEKKAKKIVSQELQSFKLRSEQDSFISRNSDYEEVIKNHLPNVLRDNPALEYAIKTHPKPWEFAYNTVKQSWVYRSQSVPKSAQAEKVLKNVSTPPSSNAIAGSLKSRVEGFGKKDLSEVRRMSQEYIKSGGR